MNKTLYLPTDQEAFKNLQLYWTAKTISYFFVFHNKLLSSQLLLFIIIIK